MNKRVVVQNEDQTSKKMKLETKVELNSNYFDRSAQLFSQLQSAWKWGYHVGGRGQITFILFYYSPISRNERQHSVTGMLMPRPYDLNYKYIYL